MHCFRLRVWAWFWHLKWINFRVDHVPKILRIFDLGASIKCVKEEVGHQKADGNVCGGGGVTSTHKNVPLILSAKK